jgi:hypothetical protein
MYIKILHHPHSGLKEPDVVPLQGDHNRVVEDHPSEPQATLKPWAPFRSRADFEYTETAVQGLLNEDVVNKQLYGLHNGWAETSSISLHSYADMERSLAAARQCGIGASCIFLFAWMLECPTLQFQTGIVSAMFEKKEYTFEFPYRSPREWLINIVTDSTLTPYISWYPIKKYLCKDGREIPLYDEPKTGQKWWNVQVMSYSFTD